MPTSGMMTIAFAAATGVMLLIGGVEGARAATVSDSQTFSIGPADVPVNDSFSLTFNKFNPALGTLTGVLFGLDSVTQTFADIGVPASQFNLPGTTNAFGKFELRIIPFFGTTATVGLATATCSPDESFQQCESTGSHFQGFTGTFPVAAGAVDDLVGPGTFDVELTYSASLVGLSCPQDLECEHTGRILWDGTLTVEYTYIAETAAVPEPGALALFGVGLAGLAVMRRRKPD